MPPKRPSRRESTSKESSTRQPPSAAPESEDAKPNVDQLNAAASLEAELPSDPLASQAEPVSVNTTPAPSARSTPSVQQIDDPNRPTPTPGPAARGKRAAPRGAGRRSQAQREELRKADDERRRVEAEQRAKEDAAKAREQGRRDGGRGRGRGDFRGGRGKGRGGYVGDAERRNKDAVASGPFSTGEITKDKRSSGKWRTSGGISRGMPSGFTSGQRGSGAQGAEGAAAEESGTFTTGMAPKKPTRSYPSYGGTSGSRTAADGTRVKPDPDSKPGLDADGDISMLGHIDISSDEDSEEKESARRFNIENLIDLTGDDDDYDPMTPVRVMRVAHKERTLGINADGAAGKDGTITVGANDAATAAKGKGKPKGKDAPQTMEISSGSDRESGPEAEPVPTIKPDPEAPSAAEEQLQEPQLAGGQSNVDDLPQDPPSSPESKRKAKEKIKSRTLSSSSQPDRPDLQTQEEIDEWDRNQTDLRILRNELGTPHTATNADGEEVEDKRAEKVYLFQFPPVLPDLAPLAIKPDPDAPPADDMEVDGQPGKNSKDNPIDVSESTSSQPKLPSGAVGKLNIHKSGRATLDWGGTSFCLGMGAEASFLQDILVAQVPDQKDGDTAMGGSREEGVAMSMGQVKGKFVITPDWEEILG